MFSFIIIYQTFKRRFFLAESGAGKTQFVKSLLKKVHAGMRLFSFSFKKGFS
jgi:tRNA A37 threonylcarbamoyladenosine biosynthesis protein TsaE